MRALYFDMDGTIADLYGVNNWLDFLKAEDVMPYREAKPLVDLDLFTDLVNDLQERGYIIGVISWLSKNGSDRYNAEVTMTKIQWLRKNLPNIHWDEIHITKYGTNKSIFGSGILFDDESNNRKDWMRADAENWAFSEKEIIEILQEII